jgi:cell division GTPase FtsZ
LEYKQIYEESVEALEKASDKLMYFTNKQFKKMHNFKKYLDNYIEHDLVNRKDDELLNKIFNFIGIKLTHLGHKLINF